MTKLCNGCKTELPLTEFYISNHTYNKNKTDPNTIRYMRICKHCMDTHTQNTTATCTQCDESLPITKFKKYRGIRSKICKQCQGPQDAIATKRYRDKDPLRTWRQHTKSAIHQRSKNRFGYDDSAIDDILDRGSLMTNCPICKQEFIMTKSTEQRIELTYRSVDRIDSSIGYVAGNMDIICYSCNSKKNTNTIQDLYRLIEYYNTHGIVL